MNDSGALDSGLNDGGVIDAGESDSGSPDGGPNDGGSVDSGTSDSGSPDSGMVDSGTPDAGAMDGGIDGGIDSGRFTLLTLDGADSGLRPISMAIDSTGRVGVAYFTDVPGHSELRYLEWALDAGFTFSTVKAVDVVSGVSLAFSQTGRPSIAYLGGGSDSSTVWLQSDAVISTRQPDAGWIHETVVQFGNEALANDVTSDRGFLVGLQASLVFDGAKAYLAYRDAHDGTFPQQDWNGSDLELAEGQSGAWAKSVLFVGGSDKQAWGGHTQLVMGRTQPALVSDQMFGGADTTASDVWFSQRNADAGWSAKQKIFTSANTQSGPSVAFDADAGFAAAVFDPSTSTFLLKTSPDGVVWGQVPSLADAGSSGWYPSVAFHPTNHTVSVAYYHCANSASAGACPSADDELRVSMRNDAGWGTIPVDSRGAYQPRLGFLPSGQMVIAYRDPRTGALLLAVER